MRHLDVSAAPVQRRKGRHPFFTPWKLMSANIKTHLHCFHGSVVAVRVSPATALVDVGDPTDAEMEAAYASDPEGTRALSDYLNEHNKDGGAYKRLKIGFGAED